MSSVGVPVSVFTVNKELISPNGRYAYSESALYELASPLHGASACSLSVSISPLSPLYLHAISLPSLNLTLSLIGTACPLTLAQIMAAIATPPLSWLGPRCPLVAPPSLDFSSPLSGLGPWSQANVSLELRKGLSSTLPGGEADVRAALWASQFRNDCSRLLLFEDDMSGCGLGFTSALIENLLLYAVAQNRVLIEVPVNSSWHNVRGHMPFNEGRKPCSAEPAVVRRRPRHAPVLLLPPHALRGAAYPYAHGATFGSWREHPQQQPDQRGGARVAVQAHVVLQNPRNRRIRERCEARGGTLPVAASRVGAPHRRVRDAAA